MTAEIAVLNRRAVAFAADSAMTISTTGKTYNSADKIFEISMKNPIGLMLFNLLDYMGMPLDVIIKDFRENYRTKSFDSLENIPDVFFDYLDREFHILGEDEDIHVSSLSAALYGLVERRFFDVVIRRRVESKDYQAVFHEVVNEFVEFMGSLADNECFWDLSIEDFQKRYNSAFEEAMAYELDIFPLNEDEKETLKNLAALSLKKSYFSSLHTGFVFAGFGDNQLFPSLRSFTFDGMIMGRLKRLQKENVSIDASRVRAKIVPFAQHEMVDRFLVGIDERHERAILSNIRRNMEDLGKSIIGAMPRMRSTTRARLQENLKISIETVLMDLRDNTVKQLKEESASESEDAVMFMAKPDLANFAEALVNITSVKRRASLETESVGGPIDVAVISRDDGFVWVRRKHYFDPDLNPRFFARKYGTLGQRRGGRHDRT